MKLSTPLTLSFLIIILFTTSLHAQAWVWGIEGAPTPSGGADPFNDHCVASDLLGNVYFVSNMGGTLTFGSDVINSAPSGTFLVKYDVNGNEDWVKQPIIPSSSPYSCNFSSITTNSSGSVFATGSLLGAAIFGIDTVSTTYPTTSAYIAKYNGAGTAIWGRQAKDITLGCLSYGIGVAADSHSNIYLTGVFNDSVIFGIDTLKGETQNMFLTKYDTNGNVLWAKQSSTLSDNASVNVKSIATDGLGDSYILGSFNDTLIFGQDTLYPAANTSAENMYIVKYSPNGNELWVRQPTFADSNGLASANSIAVDVNGNAYVTGFFIDTVFFGTTTIAAIPNQSDVFFVKYNPSGSVAWANAGVDLSGANWDGYGVMSDTLAAGGGFIIINGFGTPPLKLKYGVDTFLLNTNSRNASVVFQFDSAGNVVCGSVSGEGGEDDDDGICTDRSGRYVYIGGDLVDTTIYGPDTLTYNHGEFPFIARWQPCCIIPISVSPSDTNICAGNPVNVTLNASGANTYYWSPSINLSSDTGHTVSATPTHTTKYSIAGRTPGNPGCIGFTTATIAINPTPTVSIAPPTDNICKGSSATLTASGGNTYKWSNSSTNSTYTTSLLNADSTIKVIGYSAFGCSDTAQLNVTVKNVSALNACCNTTIVLSNDTIITVSGTNATNYIWAPSTGLNTTSGTIVIASPTVTTTYTVSATESGCPVDTVITITVVDAPISCANFTVPNVFTPNYAGTSGVNAVLYIQNNNVSTWSITVYDRWGKEVFTSTNPTQYWTGLTESGDKAPDGIYYYIVNATCQNKTYKKDGFVQLIR